MSLDNNSRSGAEFLLRPSSTGHQFVKQAKGLAGIRLISQSSKQGKFKDYEASNGWVIKTPKVRGIDRHGDDVKVTMDYVEGRGAAAIFTHLGLDTQVKVHECISEWLSSIIEVSKERPINTDMWRNKLDSVSLSANERLHYQAIEQVRESLRCPGLTTIGDSCHGDLTFSNIIISEKEKVIWVFDFLDTFDDSIVMDLSKLYQELVLGWSSRNMPHPSSRRSTSISNEVYWSYYEKLSNSSKLHSAFVANTILTILRILPYAKSEIDYEWINHSLRRCI